MELVKTFINVDVYTKRFGMTKTQRFEDCEDELYDLTGLQLDPLRKRSAFTGLQGFSITEFGKEKSYFMPKDVDSKLVLIEYVRDNFPIVDRP